MSGFIHRSRAVLALAAVLALGAGEAQAADPADFAAATVVNTNDQIAADSEFALYAAGRWETPANLTCDQPRAYPYETQKYQNIVVGSLHQHDTVLGEAHCFSFTQPTYTCRLRMEIDYFTRTGLFSGYWTYTGFGGTYPGVTISGACDAPGILDVIYPDTHVAVNRPRRVRAFVYSSLTGTAPVARYVSQTYGV